eukprot:TRINITY_DN3237_c0_g1_i1.p1 TRINITY_DN3237_c0_g1~~TRINITY_DN3237_c0_g1_i1.p1  ORF type:complete len:1168 (-),score=308.21 TRINITY_DN3237_c0_g1_i1:1056-4559(-)
MEYFSSTDIEELAEQYLNPSENVDMDEFEELQKKLISLPKIYPLDILASYLTEVSTESAFVFLFSCLEQAVFLTHNQTMIETKRNLTFLVHSFLINQALEYDIGVVRYAVNLYVSLVKVMFLHDYIGENNNRIVEELQPLLDSDEIQHHYLFFFIVQRLIDLFSSPSTNMSYGADRRILFAFRDENLNFFLKKAVEAIKVSDNPFLMQSACEVINQSLEFDFYGNLQIPRQETSTINLPQAFVDIFFDPPEFMLIDILYGLYQKLTESLSSDTEDYRYLIILIVNNMCRFKRNTYQLDPKKSIREDFLSSVLKFMIMVFHTELDEKNVKLIHELCSVLMHIRLQFEVSILCACEESKEFFELSQSFSEWVFTNQYVSPSSIVYLIKYWSRNASYPLVNSVGSVSDMKDFINLLEISSQVVRSFITGHIEHMSELLAYDNSLLSDLTAFINCESSLRTLISKTTKTTIPLINEFLENISEKYDSCLSDFENCDDLTRSLIESQLAFLIRLVALVVSEPEKHATYRYNLSSAYDDNNNGSRLNRNVLRGRGGELNEDESNIVNDATLISNTIMVLSLYEKKFEVIPQELRYNSTQQLDISLLEFMTELRRYHLQDSLDVTMKRQLQEMLNIDNVATLADLAIKQIISNLEFWSDDDVMIQKSLILLKEFCYSYFTGKQLNEEFENNYPAITQLLQLHIDGELQLDFLEKNQNAETHQNFYYSLAYLLKNHLIPKELGLYKMLVPFQPILDEIQNNCKNKDFFTRLEVISKCKLTLYDLHGVLMASNNNLRIYFYHWLFPRYKVLFEELVQTHNNNCELISALFLFLTELINDQTYSRTSESLSSGLTHLICDFILTLLTKWAKKNITISVVKDVNEEKLIPLEKALNVLQLALAPLFTHTSTDILLFYEDRTLLNTIASLFDLVSKCPMEELLANEECTIQLTLVINKCCDSLMAFVFLSNEQSVLEYLFEFMIIVLQRRGRATNTVLATIPIIFGFLFNNYFIYEHNIQLASENDDIKEFFIGCSFRMLEYANQVENFENLIPLLLKFGKEVTTILLRISLLELPFQPYGYQRPILFYLLCLIKLDGNELILDDISSGSEFFEYFIEHISSRMAISEELENVFRTDLIPSLFSDVTFSLEVKNRELFNRNIKNISVNKILDGKVNTYI